MANVVRVGVTLLLLGSFVHADLNAFYYAKTCPNVASIVRNVVLQAINAESRMAASLLRLHFHDCFVQGCDASILLDVTNGEKDAFPNKNSVRGFNVIDDIKTAVEKACPGVVSCADILALAARDSVVRLGGPSWSVPLGRRDSVSASQSKANSDLPAPTESVAQIVAKFAAKGLSTTDMVALSGGHTIGQARCTSFKTRLYNFDGAGNPDPSLNSAYLASLKQNCPSSGGDDNLSPMDFRTPNSFDTLYFSNMFSNRSLLNSDQELYYTSGTTNTLVKKYATFRSAFFYDFASAMVKMGNISPLTGSNGQIRTNCRSVNA